MILRLYHKSGTHKADISPSPSDRHDTSLMGDNILILSFVLHEFIALEVGDYIDYRGERYSLLESYNPEMRSTVEYAYSVRLYDPTGQMRFAKVLKPASAEQELSFSYDAKAAEHVRLIVDNINRITGTTEWTVGTVIDSENKPIEYNNRYCIDALTDIAREFDTEYWVEGRTVNLCRCEHGEPIRLAYRQGLRGLSRAENASAQHFTRLYPLGSTRNIDREKYGHARLQLPDGVKFVERNTHLGIIEQSEEEAFAKIYPRHTGTVTSVRTQEQNGEDGKPFTIYYIGDSDLPFDPNQYEIGGLVKKVVFQSGELNGREFEVNYRTAQKEWEIITQFPYDNQQLPGGALVPKVGDKYIPYNFRMPDEYYPLAEQELREAVDKYLEKVSEDTSVYKSATDYIDLDTRGIGLKLGQRVILHDSRFFGATGGKHETRITRISRKLDNPNDADLEFAYRVDKGKFSQLQGEVVSLQAAYTDVLEQTLITVLKSWDSADPSEYNVLSSKRTLDTIKRLALRRDIDDATDNSLFFGKRVGSKDYAEGSHGWQGTARGDFEMGSLRLREFLEVPELRYNRISVWLGVDFSSPGGGIIERVDTATQTVCLKLEDGELGAVAANDLCFGIYHSIGAADHDEDDGKGNMTVAGFATSYFKVDAVASDLRSFTYSLRPGYTVHPQPFMHFAVRGNVTNTDRQRFKYSTRSYERYLAGVNDWEWRGSNIAAQLGDLSNLRVFGLQMEGYSAYLNNVYFHGTIQELPDAINDQIMQLIGTGNIRCIVESTHGNEFGDIGWRTDMRASVVMGVYGLIDKTDEVTVWRWTRQSGSDPDSVNSDLLWDSEHQHYNSRDLTVEVGRDIPPYAAQCVFTCAAEMPDRSKLEGKYDIELRS